MDRVFSFSLFSSALAISFAITPAYSGYSVENDALKTPSIKPNNMKRIKEQPLSPRSLFDVFSLKDNPNSFSSKVATLHKDSSTTQQMAPSHASRRPQRQLAAVFQQVPVRATEEKLQHHFSTVSSLPSQQDSIPEAVVKPQQVLPLKGILRSPGQQSPLKNVKFNEKDNVAFIFNGTAAPTTSLEKSFLPGRVNHVKNGGTSITQRSDLLNSSQTNEKLSPFIQASFKEYIAATHKNNAEEMDVARRKITMGAHWGHTGAQYFMATKFAKQKNLAEALDWVSKAKKDPKNMLAAKMHTKLLTKLHTQYRSVSEQSNAFQSYTAALRIKNPCVPSKVPVAFPWKYKKDGKTYSTLNGGLRSVYNQAIQLLSDDSSSPEAYEKLKSLTEEGRVSKWLESAAHFRLYEFEQRRENSAASISHLQSAAKLGLKTAQYLYGKHLIEQDTKATEKNGVRYLNKALLQDYWPAGEILTKHFKEKASKLAKLLKTYGKLPVASQKVTTKRK